MGRTVGGTLAVALVVLSGAAAGCGARVQAPRTPPIASSAASLPRSRVPSGAELRDALLLVADLPSGYRTGGEPDPEAMGEPPAPGAGCDRLFAYFGGEAGTGAGVEASAEFEKGETGPFLTQELTVDEDAGRLHRTLEELRGLVAGCAGFTSTNADGSTSAVTVSGAPLTVRGDESVVFALAVAGVMSGYLVAVRIGNTLATIVHFGLPGVEFTETERLVAVAVDKVTPVAR